MRYLGGKSRISKSIATILNAALSAGGGAREGENIRKPVLWLMCC